MADIKRARKPYWSKNEICSLLEAISFHQGLIFSKFRSADSNKKKQTARMNIVSRVCAQNDSAPRSAEEVKKKWKDLVSQAKKDAYNRKYPKTGGGPKPQEGEWTDTILDIFGRDSPLFHGIEGGGESGEVSKFSSQGEIQKFVNILVQVGVPFSAPEEFDVGKENVSEFQEVHATAEMPATSSPCQTDIEVVLVDHPPSSGECGASSNIPAVTGILDTPKRKCSVRPSQKRSYEDLVSVDYERAVLEKQKLLLEIEKLKKGNKGV